MRAARAAQRASFGAQVVGDRRVDTRRMYHEMQIVILTVNLLVLAIGEIAAAPGSAVILFFCFIIFLFSIR
jgi:hypothetical protein